MSGRPYYPQHTQGSSFVNARQQGGGLRQQGADQYGALGADHSVTYQHQYPPATSYTHHDEPPWSQAPGYTQSQHAQQPQGYEHPSYQQGTHPYPGDHTQHLPASQQPSEHGWPSHEQPRHERLGAGYAGGSYREYQGSQGPWGYQREENLAGAHGLEPEPDTEPEPGASTGLKAVTELPSLFRSLFKFR